MLQATFWESEVQTFLDQHAVKVAVQSQRLMVRIGDGTLCFCGPSPRFAPASHFLSRDFIIEWFV